MKGKSMIAVVGLLLAAASLACAGGSGGQSAGGGFGEAPDRQSEEVGGLSSRTSGEGLVGDGPELDLGGQVPDDGAFELAIAEDTLESGLTAALRQAGYLSEDQSATVDIRSDETILIELPYTIEETETEVTAELVYRVFVESDGSIGVELIAARFTTAQGLSVDVPAERMDALNAALEEALAAYSGSGAEVGVTWTDIRYLDTDMTLVGMVAP